jgi:hypothetical protein
VRACVPSIGVGHRLASPEAWPQSLETIVCVMLDSGYAMWMLWGPEFTFFCNDADLPNVAIKLGGGQCASCDAIDALLLGTDGVLLEQAVRRYSCDDCEFLLRKRDLVNARRQSAAFISTGECEAGRFAERT